MSEEAFSLYVNQIYWYLILSVFIAVGLWENFYPARELSEKIRSRWWANFSLLMSVYLIVYLIKPIVSASSAIVSQNLSIGIFNNSFITNIWIEIVIVVLLLDLVNYLSHRFFHYSSFCWRFHRVHHSDINVDLSTGWRFHPLEAIISAFVHSLMIGLFGISLYAVLMHAIIAIVFNMFTHANILLPAKVEKNLSFMFITPNIHLLHHSVNRDDHDTNYGNIFSFWDRILRTLNTKLTNDMSKVITGLKDFRSSSQINLLNLFLMPFRALSN